MDDHEHVLLGVVLRNILVGVLLAGHLCYYYVRVARGEEGKGSGCPEWRVGGGEIAAKREGGLD
jgi:hypothetical protein